MLDGLNSHLLAATLGEPKHLATMCTLVLYGFRGVQRYTARLITASLSSRSAPVAVSADDHASCSVPDSCSPAQAVGWCMAVVDAWYTAQLTASLVPQSPLRPRSNVPVSGMDLSYAADTCIGVLRGLAQPGSKLCSAVRDALLLPAVRASALERTPQLAVCVRACSALAVLGAHRPMLLPGCRVLVLGEHVSAPIHGTVLRSADDGGGTTHHVAVDSADAHGSLPVLLVGEANLQPVSDVPPNLPTDEAACVQLARSCLSLAARCEQASWGMAGHVLVTALVGDAVDGDVGDEPVAAGAWPWDACAETALLALRVLEVAVTSPVHARHVLSALALDTGGPVDLVMKLAALRRSDGAHMLRRGGLEAVVSNNNQLYVAPRKRCVPCAGGDTLPPTCSLSQAGVAGRGAGACSRTLNGCAATDRHPERAGVVRYAQPAGGMVPVRHLHQGRRRQGWVVAVGTHWGRG